MKGADSRRISVLHAGDKARRHLLVTNALFDHSMLEKDSDDPGLGPGKRNDRKGGQVTTSQMTMDHTAP